MGGTALPAGRPSHPVPGLGDRAAREAGNPGVDEAGRRVVRLVSVAGRQSDERGAGHAAPAPPVGA